MLGKGNDSRLYGTISVKARTRALALFLFAAVASLGFIYPRLASTAGAVTPLEPQKRSVEPARRTQGRGRRSTAGNPSPQQPRRDYSNFSHKTLAHQKACDSCHRFPSANWKEVRQGDAAFTDITDYPQHASCVECHRQQFFSGARPVICSVCHTNPGPRDSTRFPFPSLGEPFYATRKGKDFTSDFRVNFPHAKHMDLIGRAETGDEDSLLSAAHARNVAAGRQQADKSCATCHETLMPQGKSDEEYVTKPPKNLGDAFWLKKGTFKTIPLTHATCFTCHSADTGIKPAPTDCNVCHQISQGAQLPVDFDPKLAQAMGVTDNLLLTTWRRRESSGAFRHEGGMHPDISCTACHKVETMNTLDARTLRVSILSCGGGETGCHITPTSDDGGALNVAVDQRKTTPSFECSKCHVTFGRAPVPASHIDAIKAAAAKPK